MPTILLVEDESMIRDLLIYYLDGQGYRVICASDGARGILLARKEQPNVILMDMGLPILNGWQATHRLKTASDTRHIPIIALTAYALVEDRVRSLEIGCDAFVSKPIEFARLNAAIHAVLDQDTSTSTRS